tara:strand:- start:225 stop:584 length:360 start_codon:yes stop_codon:yes gene_type:complete
MHTDPKQLISESIILKDCLNYLTFKKIPAWRNNTGVFSVHDKSGTRYIRSGIAGSPDIIGYVPAKDDEPAQPLFFEVKRYGGKLTKLQRNFLDNAKEKGCRYAGFGTLEDLMELFKEGV